MAVSLHAQFSELHLDVGGSDNANEIEVVGDHILIAGTTTFAAEDRNAGVFCLLGLDGKVSSTHRLSGRKRSSIAGATRVDDNSFLLGGWENNSSTIDDMSFYHFSTEGGLLGSWRYGRQDEDEQTRYLLRLGPNDFLSVGNLGTTKIATVVRFDLQGNVRWRRTFNTDSDGFDLFMDAVLLASGDILLVGQLSSSRSNTEFYLTRLSPDGDLVSSHSYLGVEENSGRGLSSLTALPNGNVAVSTIFIGPTENRQILVAEVNMAGGIVAQHAYGSDENHFISSAILTPRNTLVMAGASSQQGEAKAMALEVSLTGQILNEAILSDRDTSRISDLALAPGGGYYFAGDVTSCGDPSRDMLLVYLNENFERPDGCVQGKSGFRKVDPPILSVMETGTLRPREEPRLAAEAPAPTSLTVKRITCPVFDLDADDSSAPPMPTYYRGPEVCYGGPEPITDEDLILGPIYPDSIVISCTEFGELVTEDQSIASRRLPGQTNVIIYYPTSLEQARRALLATRYQTDLARVPVVAGQITSQVFYGCQSIIARSRLPFLDRPIRSNLTDTVACPGQPLTLDASNPAVELYSWDGGPDSATYTVPGPGIYTISLSNKCLEVRDTLEVVAGAKSFGRQSGIEDVICLGDSLRIDLSTAEVSEYLWSDGFVGPERTLRTSSTFTASLANNCFNQEVLVAPVVISCCEVFVPTAFSPNRDGVNDTFGPLPALSGCELAAEFQLRVYDRWGGLLFNSSVETPNWDGTAANQALQPGIYTYLLTYFDGLNSQQVSGSVTLLR